MSFNIVEPSNLDDKILYIEFRNINKNNALSLLMLDELAAILSQKHLRNKYQVIVFRGYKDSSFSAGADLKDVKSLKKMNKIDIYHNKLNLVLTKLSKLKALKVSVLKDFCIGAGFIFAMHTDICIANSSCLFSIPASKLNIKLPKAQLDFLFNKYPKNLLLKEILLTGRNFTATEALNFHLINLVYQDKDFKKSYLKFLSSFTKNDKKIQEYYFNKIYIRR